MKRLIFSVAFVLVASLVFLTCAPYKMKAIRAQRDQRHELAIHFALKHLSSHPNDAAVIRLLNKSANGYYQELQKKIIHFEKLNKWEKVAGIADQGFKLLTDVADVTGVEFPTKNELDFLKSKKEQSSIKQADELYRAAVKLYQNKNLLKALDKFKECQAYASHFKDSDKYISEISSSLAQENYQHAMQLLSQNKLEKALENFQKANKYVPDFLDVQEQINQVQFQLADRYFNKGQEHYSLGDYKTAIKELERALSYKPDHTESETLLKEIKDKLTVRMAVLPFSVSKLDSKFGKITSDKILTNALSQKTEFVQFLDRENLQKIFEEQALSQTGAVDERTAVQVGKLSGVNTIVMGTVTLINHQLTRPTKRAKTAYYNQYYKDPKGVQRKKKVPFNYNEFEITRNAEVNLSYRLINVETGAIMFSQSLSKKVSDTARWITCPSQFVSKLPESEKKKLKGRKTPQPKETLINKAIDQLSAQAASQIIQKVRPL